MPIQEQPKSSTQHAVPQNIMDVEFKLIGELTMRQFVYILIFSLAAYMAKLSVPQPFTWFFVVGLGLLGLALAFVPFEDRGLDEWIVNFLQAINSPTLRIWRKEAEIPTAFAYEQNLRFVQQELITLAPTASRRKLEEYLNQRGQQTVEDILDIPEQEYIDMVREAFKETEQESEAVQEVTVKSQTQPQPQQPQAQKQPQKQDQEEQDSQKDEKEMPQKEKIPEDEDKMAKIIRSRIKQSRVRLLEEEKIQKGPQLRPMGSHSGRKFVNLTPGQGEIILPIRGERVITPTGDDKFAEKSERLQKLLNKSESEAKQGEKRLAVREIPSSINKPNIVSGIIKNRKGDLLENVVVVIRNEKGEPVRALKTNKLGKFFITSPLPEGNYEIEVDKTNKTDYSFDIIPIKVEGGLLPAYEIIGR